MLHNTIIFIVKTTFCKRDYDRLGIEKLEKRGINVIVWDVTKKFNEEHFYTYKPIINFSQYKLVKSKKTLIKIFKGLHGNEVIILTFHKSYKYLLLYRLLSHYKLFYGFLHNNPIPVPTVKNFELTKRSLKQPLKSIFSTILDFIFKRIPPKYLKINPPNFVLVGGSKSVQTISYNIDKNTDIIWGHSYDYEIHHYNNNDLNTTLNIQPYALFLDQYWPFHSNFPPQKITPEYYYNKLNDFFCHIEEKFNLSIIIAGHPERKKLGKSSEQYFVHRKVIYDKTYALVLNAQFIIAHFSTSINYAVMSYKPIMFIYLDTLPEFCIEHTCYLSELYDQPLYNISNNSYKNNINGIWNINKHTYDIRINDYIKTNKSPQKGLHDILADYLDSRIIK